RAPAPATVPTATAGRSSCEGWRGRPGRRPPVPRRTRGRRVPFTNEHGRPGPPARPWRADSFHPLAERWARRLPNGPVTELHCLPYRGAGSLQRKWPRETDATNRERDLLARLRVPRLLPFHLDRLPPLRRM